jgi:hypothetical protein
MLALISVSGVNVRHDQFPDEFRPSGISSWQMRAFGETYERKASKEFYWDVFDADGRYIARVPIVHEIQLWRDGRAYFIVEDEDGYKTIRCCRARWEKP